MDPLLSYDNICLYPNHSCLKSRSLADTTASLCGWKFILPVVPANMQDVIDFSNAEYLSKYDYFYIMHRFNGATPNFIPYANERGFKLISVSIGTKDYEKDLVSPDYRIDFITIDVAHGFHDNVIPVIEYVRSNYPKAKLIVGNVATREGVKFLTGLGADIIKCGIGGSQICTTRFKTGFHVPTLQSVVYAQEALNDMNLHIPIIADGGAKHYGDVAKALTMGASFVMSGSWFASCINSPAKIKNGKKIYRGSTSFEMKGHNNHIEGKTLELDEAITYSDRLIEIEQALQSSISYAGGKDLSAFKSVKWGRINL
jgi:GMP reductase